MAPRHCMVNQCRCSRCRPSGCRASNRWRICTMDSKLVRPASPEKGSRSRMQPTASAFTHITRPSCSFTMERCCCLLGCRTGPSALGLAQAALMQTIPAPGGRMQSLRSTTRTWHTWFSPSSRSWGRHRARMTPWPGTWPCQRTSGSGQGLPSLRSFGKVSRILGCYGWARRCWHWSYMAREQVARRAPGLPTSESRRPVPSGRHW
mmetsp:Transcript_48673/g.105833  ORF Transcript_48673/g.105833 Transcript_48673/m.105833 type:complete len:206 (+) Transcript_48673:49-666(+)